MTSKNEITTFICGKPTDHKCNNDGPVVYGGENVPPTPDREKAGKGYTWGSVTCSICGLDAMTKDMFNDW